MVKIFNRQRMSSCVSSSTNSGKKNKFAALMQRWVKNVQSSPTVVPVNCWKFTMRSALLLWQWRWHADTKHTQTETETHCCSLSHRCWVTESCRRCRPGYCWAGKDRRTSRPPPPPASVEAGWVFSLVRFAVASQCVAGLWQKDHESRASRDGPPSSPYCDCLLSRDSGVESWWVGTARFAVASWCGAGLWQKGHESRASHDGPPSSPYCDGPPSRDPADSPHWC